MTQHAWIDNEKVYVARPVSDCIVDGLTLPDNPRVRWVVFLVFTTKSGLEFDGVGYAESLEKAKRGILSN
jgi:hypothetical protein